MIEKVKLGDKVEFQRGYDLTHSQMHDGPFPVVGSTSVIGYHDEYKAEDGITLGRSGTVGIPQLIKGKYWPHNTSLFTTDLKGNNLEYLYYLLINLHIDKLKTGSNIPTLNRNDIYPMVVPFETDVLMQGRIAAVLSSIDEKIINNKAISSDLEAMAKLLFDFWFVQFDFPDENGKPYKSSGGSMIWNDELKREIPEGWDVAPLKGLYSIERGLSYTSDDISLGVGVPMINLACIDRDRNYRDGELKYYANKVPEDAYLKAGELLIACTDLTREREIIGCPVLVPDDGKNYTYSMDIAKISFPTGCFNDMYMYMALRTDFYHNYIKMWASGTNVLHLNLEGLDWYKICIPPIDLQNNFAALIRNIHSRKSDIITENQQLASLRDFLLPMLMNGQVKVGGNV